MAGEFGKADVLEIISVIVMPFRSDGTKFCKSSELQKRCTIESKAPASKLACSRFLFQASTLHA